MLLLIFYVLVALVFSFLCSIAEAVLLSVTTPYIALQEEQGSRTGPLLKSFKRDIDRPLAAILTLNTIAHTVGAAGAGAQAANVFGNAYVGVASAILTLLILIFSEIIPKTLGATYWRQLAPATVWFLRYLITLLYPFVWASEHMTGLLSGDQKTKLFTRGELAAMADLGHREGQLAEHESRIMKNLFRFRDARVADAMTPRPVVFAIPEGNSVSEFLDRHDRERFSRIPLFQDDPDQIVGFVLRNDLLLAQARGNGDKALSEYRRELTALPNTASLPQAFEDFLDQRAQIMLVVNEFGGMEGILTLEDVLETLLGLEIIDESDRTVDLRQQARALWKRRARAMGLSLDDDPRVD